MNEDFENITISNENENIVDELLERIIKLVKLEKEF
jgi:hypothetical protein